MIGVIAGGALAILVLLLALHRPLLARLGTLQAFRRPRQTAVIALGLMFATVVLGASAIAADSTRHSFQEALLTRARSADIIFSAIHSPSPFDVDDVETLRDLEPLRGHVTSHSAALRWSLPFDDEQTRLGTDRLAVWGIDPASWVPMTGMQPLEGDLPASLKDWKPGTILLNRAAASRVDASIGDRATVYFPPHTIEVSNVTTFQGDLAAAALNPVSNTYMHSPADRYQFVYNLTEDARRVVVRADTNQQADLHLSVIGPRGRQANLTGGAHPAIVVAAGQREVQAGTYRIQVDSPRAANVSFRVTVNATMLVESAPTLLEGRIIGIVSDAGSDPLEGAPAALLPLSELQRGLNFTGKVNVLLVGTDGTPRVFQNDRYGSDWQRLAHDRTGQWLEVRAPQEELALLAAQIDLETRSFFLGLGSFTLAAGFMLIAVLLALLVEERKPMLGALRAVGAQRRDLTRMHLHEGAVYAALAAVAGLLGAAVLVAWIGEQVKKILSEEDMPFGLHFETATLLSVLGFGFAVTLVVIGLAAHKAVAIDVPAALRNEESSRRARVWPTLVVLALGFLVTAVGVLAQERVSLVIGPVFLGFGAASLAGRWVNRYLAVSLAALGTTIYVASTFYFIPLDDEVAAILIPIRGVILAVAASILAAYSVSVHRFVGLVLRPIRGIGPLVETALSHLRRRPGRAALTMAMVATVLTVMTALGTLFSSTAPLDLNATGGYTVFGNSDANFTDARAFYAANPPRSGANPFPLIDDLLTLPLASSGTYRLELAGDNRSGLSSRAYLYGNAMVGVTQQAADRLEYEASSLAPGYADVRAALRAVANDPRLMVISSGTEVDHYAEDDYRVERARVGMRFTTFGGEDEYEVIAILKGVGTAGTFVHPSVVYDLQGDAETRIYARPIEGVTDAELARELEAGLRRAGLHALPVSESGRQDQTIYHALQLLLGVFLGLGIVVGMVSLGLVTARNVVVRRREIGMLRAVGAQRGQILGLFVIETIYVTVMAVLIGLGAGLILATSVLLQESFVTFSIDWNVLLVLYGTTLLAAVATVVVPALRAARTPPAEAVRYVE